ncbi:hypothetical protein SAMN05421503_1815 [Terribacillus aidingensis]|uniref:Uncharacterized protein n=1 Tax=Terribacillus aidingensis TaxID=586416 RepID=A0A285NM95_9BACI|nr:hypothetical protein [Terribacillus aidingensis]SNZ10630.1 hypothetical protein SAMN05421503_1815 [Terribacillus aidingensis]
MNETPTELINRIAAKVRSYQQMINPITEAANAFQELKSRLAAPADGLKIIIEQLPEYIRNAEKAEELTISLIKVTAQKGWTLTGIIPASEGL